MALAYQVSDIVVSASIEPEAFGRVSVEAQSMEKPILASNIGGSTETIIPEKTGWLFKSESPSELANSIEMIKKMDKKIAEELGIPINNTDDPLSSVVIGSGICLERFQDYKSVLKQSPKPN